MRAITRDFYFPTIPPPPSPLPLNPDSALGGAFCPALPSRGRLASPLSSHIVLGASLHYGSRPKLASKLLRGPSEALVHFDKIAEARSGKGPGRPRLLGQNHLGRRWTRSANYAWGPPVLMAASVRADVIVGRDRGRGEVTRAPNRLGKYQQNSLSIWLW
jgi:hypothetical protein